MNSLNSSLDWVRCARLATVLVALNSLTISRTSLQQRLVMMVSNCTSCSDVLGSAFYVIGVGNPLFGGLLDLGCERHA